VTDDGERIARVEVRVENLEQSIDKVDTRLEKLRSERVKMIIAALFMALSTLLAIFRNVLPF